MSEPIDVLVVEDSPLFSEAIQNVLESDSSMRVVGVAGNGREAVEMTERLRPQVITMDVHMPVMGGLEAIEKIMADWPTPILVVTSDPRATPGDELHFEALRRGALDVFPKPRQWPGDTAHQEAMRLKVKLISHVAVVRHLAGHRHRWRGNGCGGEALVQLRKEGKSRKPAVKAREVPPSPKALAESRAELDQRSGDGRLVALVASTGGPAAIARIFEALPKGFGAPIVVVQHISTGFAASFASWLNDVSSLECRLATHDELLRPGLALIAPDDQHLTVTASGRVCLDKRKQVDGHRPSGTVLLDSVARNYGRRGVGVILTGMGSDGARGLEALRQAKGITLAQDEQSSVVFGMPKVALEQGAASASVPLAELAETLQRLVTPVESRSGTRGGR